MSDDWQVTRGAPDGAIHEWFGLSYANYLVLPRSILQSMPVDWQEGFVDHLRRLDDHFAGYDYNPDGGFLVQPRSITGKFSSDWKVPAYNRGRTFICRREAS